MASAELTASLPAAQAAGHRQPLAAATAIVCALTAAGVLLGTLAPALVPDGEPHPSLHGSTGEALSILAQNLRVLAPPFVLAAFGVHHSRTGRRFGDLLIATVTTVNTLHVGLAIGHLGTRLLPYLPHLPLEWLALTISLASWLEMRTPPANRRTIARNALIVLALTTAAAGCETLLTPHLPDRTRRQRASWHSARLPSYVAPSKGSWAGFLAPESCTGCGHVAARSLTLPSPRTARFRSATGRACPGSSTHPRSPRRD